jgi:urease accessory protein UreF
MDEHKENATWRKAYDVGRDVHQLTARIHPANTIIHTLRERSAAVPVALGMISASSETHADRVRIAYDYAHDTEYLLFYAMVLRYLGTDDVRALIWRVHEVKALLVAEYPNTNE